MKKKHETWRKQKRISFSSRRLFNFSFTHDSPFASNLLISLFIVQYDPYFNFSSFIIGGMHSKHSLNRHLQYISSHDKSCVQRHTSRTSALLRLFPAFAASSPPLPFIRKTQIFLRPLFGLISVWCLTPILKCHLLSD